MLCAPSGERRTPNESSTEDDGEDDWSFRLGTELSIRDRSPHLWRGRPRLRSGVWAFVGPGMLRRSKIFIVKG
jgi:hypothetical protein